MKVVDIFFLVNFVTIYSLNTPEHIALTPQSPKLPQSPQSPQSPKSPIFIDDGADVKNSFEKTCPHILKMIRDKNLTEYTVNCKTLSLDTNVANEESVLQEACLVVHNMFSFLCENKPDGFADILKQDNVTSVCPFQFSHLQQLGFKLGNFELVKELTKEKHCSKVCYDLYETKPQCIVLNQFNEYLKSLFSPPPEENPAPLMKEKLATNPEHRIIQKTESSKNNTQKIKDDQSANIAAKEIMSKTINETKLESSSGTLRNVEKAPKEEKVKITSTAKVIDVQKNEEKTIENKNVPEDTEYKAELDGQSEEVEVGLSSLSNTNLDRSELRAPEKIADQSAKRKEIYSGDGFFQAEDSHFFFYFIAMSSIIVIGYVAFHNKNKILAYALEGTSNRRSRRRPNPARYRKLETNLEEAISSSTINSAASSVVY